MMKFYRTIDTILVGTQNLRLGTRLSEKKRQQKPIFDKNVTNYIFSRKPPKNPTPGVEFVSEPVKSFARRLRSKPGKHIWMMGGGELIASFLDAGEIDEFQIKIIPVFIGKGVPLIAPRHRDISLRLLSPRESFRTALCSCITLLKNKRENRRPAASSSLPPTRDTINSYKFGAEFPWQSRRRNLHAQLTTATVANGSRASTAHVGTAATGRSFEPSSKGSPGQHIRTYSIPDPRLEHPDLSVRQTHRKR